MQERIFAEILVGMCINAGRHLLVWGNAFLVPIHAGERIGNAKESKNSDNSNEALLLLLVTTNLMTT